MSGTLSVSTQGLAFIATDPSGNFGLYFSDFATGSLTRLLAAGDKLDGLDVGFVFAGYQALDGREVAFNAGFQDGTSGLYVARIEPSAIPEPSSLYLAPWVWLAWGRPMPSVLVLSKRLENPLINPGTMPVCNERWRRGCDSGRTKTNVLRCPAV